MDKKYKHKSEEAAARERAHQFGQPGANPQGNPGAAVDVRKFLRWAETEATEEELRAYAADKANPYLKRRTCELTDEEAMNALMNGERADIAFTSPPYNMMASNISAAFKSDKVEDTYGIENGTYQEFNDNLSNEDYAKLLNDALDNCLAHSDEVLFNIGILKGSKVGILDMLYKHSKQFADLLVWNKNTCMPLCLPTQLHMLNHICEPIFCFNHEGDRTFSHSQWKLGLTATIAQC